MIMLFGRQTSISDVKLAIWQIVIFFLAFIIPLFASALSAGVPGPLRLDAFDLSLNGVLFAGLLSIATFAFGLDYKALRSGDHAFPFRLALAILAGGTLAALTFHFLPSFSPNPGLLALSLALAFAGILATRRLTSWLGGPPRRVIIVGTGDSALRVRNLMTRTQPAQYRLVGFYGTGPTSPAAALVGGCLLDNEGSLVDLATRDNVDEIIVALDDRRGALPIDALLKAKLQGVQVTDLVTFYERECSTIKFEQMHPSWIVFSNDFRLGPGKQFAKRAFDLAVAVVMLILTAPLMLLVAVASFLESRGRAPILYRQERVGYGGETFHLHKFRSMRVNAEGDGQARWASSNDSRVTRLGRILRKYRLDELPQLFNVLVGEMSLVGPRPERPEFVRGLTADIPYYGERHCVKPGLAGWAQLMYPYGASVEDAKRKLEYDLYYIKHTSVLWDFVILMRTVEVVLLGKGGR